MKNANSDCKIIIREGTRNDNKELLRLTSVSPMMGRISLRIDRAPDFFRLMKSRGDSFVLVAESGKKIVGSYSVAISKVYVNGIKETLCNLCDLKVDPGFRKTTLAVRLVKAAFEKLSSMDMDLLACTVASGNNDVAPFFEGRASIVPGVNAGTFKVLQIFPAQRQLKSKIYQLSETSLTAEYLDFFNDFSRQYQLGPVYKESSLKNTFLLTAFFHGECVASLTLADVSQEKQNVLINLPSGLKMLAFLIRTFSRVIPVIRLPRVNGKVQILYIRSFAFKQGHEKALYLLIRKARHLAWIKKYHFLNIGIHEKDTALPLFSCHPHVVFKSIGWVGSMKGHRDKLEAITRGVPFQDFSLV